MKFIAGILIGALATLTVPAGAAQGGQVKPAPIDSECRSNGDGGFRRCDILLNGPRQKMERVDVWVYINGREEFSMTYRPVKVG